MTNNKGQGWHGDTPEHKAAANKRAMNGTSRKPMINRELVSEFLAAAKNKEYDFMR